MNLDSTTQILKEIASSPAGWLVIGLIVYMIYLYYKHRRAGSKDQQKKQQKLQRWGIAGMTQKDYDTTMKRQSDNLKKKYGVEHLSDKEFNDFVRKQVTKRRLAKEEAQKATERQERVGEMQEALESLPPVRYDLGGMACRNCGAPLSKPTCDYCDTMHRLVKSEMKGESV